MKSQKILSVIPIIFSDGILERISNKFPSRIHVGIYGGIPGGNNGAIAGAIPRGISSEIYSGIVGKVYGAFPGRINGKILLLGKRENCGLFKTYNWNHSWKNPLKILWNKC